MPDVFSEVSSTGYLSRLGSSIKGVVGGAMFFVLAFPLLFMNEGCAVERYKILAEGRGSIVEVANDKVDETNEGKLVYLNGEAATDETLSDNEFDVSVSGVALNRHAEMYQWVEEKETKTKKKLGGGEETVTTFTYTKEWNESLVTPSDFDGPGAADHVNPESMPVRSNSTLAADVRLGAFLLSPDLVGQISGVVDVPITDEMVKKAAETFGRKAIREANWLFLGDSPAAPQIGDLRVRFDRIPSPQTVSMFAAQRQDSFSSWATPSGGTLEQSLMMGIKTPVQMFEQKEAERAMITWIVRAVGFFVMFMGIALVLKPLSVLADVLPIFGDIVGVGTAIVAFLIAAPLSLMTIAVAWLFYRPLIGIPLVIAAVAMIVGLIWLIKKYRAGNRAAATETNAQ